MNQYEAMFLFDPTFAADFGNVKAEIERILRRAEAEIVFLEKWEERKLAYEIEGRKRGLYVLTYFKCAGEKIVGIERDAKLSEPILRILIRCAEGLTREDMEKFMPQARASSDDHDSDSGDDRRSGRGDFNRERRPAAGGAVVAEKPAPAPAAEQAPAPAAEQAPEQVAEKPAPVQAAEPEGEKEATTEKKAAEE